MAATLLTGSTNPTGLTASTFDRDQKVRSALDDMARVQTDAATPYSVQQALIHAFAEGGWRHGFTLMPEAFMATAKHAQSAEIHMLVNDGKRMKVTIEYER